VSSYDTGWMHRVFDAADAVFFLRGRVSFVDINEQKSGTPASPSALLAFGETNVAAIEQAAAKGLIKGKLFFERRKAETFFVAA